jgi:hypothetical protein|tara:strand:+ start:476 stop:970 length:495 start_codon:yes stop_codon:yes gene_type:complete
VIDQASIKKEIRDWSKEVLETETPVCPFAKKTWQEEKVDVVLSDCVYWTDLIDISQNFPKDKDVVIYCDLNMDVDVFNFDSRISILNSFLNPHNLWVMGFHQEHDAKEIVEQEHFVPHFKESYNMLFMQKLDELNKASERLQKIGYYNNWDEEEFLKILERRSK